MSVTTDEVIWILVRYLCGEMKMGKDDVLRILLQEALIARGLMKPMTEKEKTDGSV